MKRTIIIF